MKIEARQSKGWISSRGGPRVAVVFEADDYEKHSTFSFEIHSHAVGETYMATRLTLYITHEDAEQLLLALALAVEQVKAKVAEQQKEDTNATV